MNDRLVRVLVLAALVAALPAAASAQQRIPRQQPAQADPQAAPPAIAAKPAPLARAVACSGVFGKESSHLKLAIAFDSKNVEFTEVDGPAGTKLPASVVFPKDPKRRLEVLWQNEAARTDTALIVITGKSQWTAPKGLRLGLALTALEKLNGKPFKLAGFDQDNRGSVIDWDGGALSSLPGDCKVGVRLVADPKAGEAARTAAGGKELASNDAAIRAVRPTVGEIILGY